MDDGSFMDVLYLDTLGKIKISPRCLKPALYSFCGFTGDTIFVEESIELAISFEEELIRSTTISNFMVIKGKSVYNIIMGRQTVAAVKAVISIYHYCLKFPILRGVGTI